jgi:hemerythrin-like metal-binding protein
MDSAHRRLVELMTLLESQNNSGEPRPRVDATFRALGDATRRHFAEEEQYMASIGYPDIAQHKAIHTSLLEKFTAHYERFRTSSSGRVDPAVFEFLTFWLRSHISGIDRRYADHAHAGRGASAR